MRKPTSIKPCLDNLAQLELERNALELELKGYTVVENAFDPDLTQRALNATLDTFEARNGKRPDVATGEGYEGYSVSRCMLFRDRAFEEVLMNEKVLALVDFLIDDDCILSTLTAHMRGQGGGETLPTGYLPLHGDDTSPMVHPGMYNLVTVNYFLTDVTEESGCLAFVPGSHKLNRQTIPSERILAGEGANPDAVPVTAPAGSAVIWPAHTFHGSWVSKTPGVRVTLATLFARPYIQPYEMFRETVPDEVLERNSPRFATLMGMDTINGWNHHKDDWNKRWGDRDRRRYLPAYSEG